MANLKGIYVPLKGSSRCLVISTILAHIDTEIYVVEENLQRTATLAMGTSRGVFAAVLAYNN
jgi:hypothetical protein|tara:strand:- start:157 stop:342 length:186 start_codon:yes stop_codon:yes gene_type:complete